MPLALDTLLAHATTQLLTAGAHPPTLVIEVKGRAKPITRQVRPFPGTAEQRLQALFAQGRAFGTQVRRPLQQVALITEVWYTHPAEAGKLLAPSLDPQRQEGLSILQLDAQSFTQTLHLYTMVRNEHHTLSALEPLPLLPTGEAEGSTEVASGLLLAFLLGVTMTNALTSDAQRIQRVHRALLEQLLRLERFHE